MEVDRPRKFTYTYRCKYGEEIPNGITHLKVHSSGNLKKISDYIFQNYESLRNVSTPPNVQNIGNSAFSGCQSITVVKFSNGLQVIDEDAFSGCRSLRRLSLPRTVKYLGRNSFWGCLNLTVVKLNEGLTEIEAGAFVGCKSLTKISIPMSVVHVCFGTFQGCINLVDVNLENVRQIGQRAFRGCRSLCAISIPQINKCIGLEAFRGCTSLLSVELARKKPESFHDYLQFCFDGCPSLVSISIPRKAYSLPESGPFAGCTALAQYAKNRRTRGRSLKRILHRRFKRLPIHKLCYHASTTRKRDLARKLQVASIEEKNKKDDYGMTPFHIFATSAKLREGLLRLLLESYPAEKLKQQDVRGYTMAEYLFQNMTSKSVKMIKLVLHKAIVEQMDQLRLEHSKRELSALIDSLSWNGDYEYRRLCMDEVLAKLGFYMRTEMVYFLELGLWKKQIRKAVRSSTRNRKKRSNKRRRVDRESCRVTSGATVAIPFVVDFLWDINSPEFSDVAMAPQSVSWLGRRPSDPSDDASVISISSGSIGVEEESFHGSESSESLY